MSSRTGSPLPRLRRLLSTPSFEAEALPLILLCALVGLLTTLVVLVS